jgi:DNA-binding MarR family transcriptional regulator
MQWEYQLMSNLKHIKHLSLYETPDESPGYLLWRVSVRWRSAIEHALKPLHLTHPQFVILATLSWLTQDGALVNQAEVGQLAGLDPNTTSQILRGLEKKSIIQRIALQDERSKNPVLTEQGKNMLAQALPIVEKIDIQFFNTLNDLELKQLKDSFKTLLIK